MKREGGTQQAQLPFVHLNLTEWRTSFNGIPCDGDCVLPMDSLFFDDVVGWQQQFIQVNNIIPPNHEVPHLLPCGTPLRFLSSLSISPSYLAKWERERKRDNSFKAKWCPSFPLLSSCLFDWFSSSNNLSTIEHSSKKGVNDVRNRVLALPLTFVMSFLRWSAALCWLFPYDFAFYSLPLRGYKR